MLGMAFEHFRKKKSIRKIDKRILLGLVSKKTYKEKDHIVDDLLKSHDKIERLKAKVKALKTSQKLDRAEA